MDTAQNEAFFDTLPVFEQFEGVADGDNYRPLPDGWALASADIVGSTKAIASGRYKAVNMAGASVISAILNGVGRRDLPFVFGGDGAFVAIPGSAIEATLQALAAVKTWVGEELQLDLRAAIVPMADIRAQGFDVRVARFQASSEIAYAMFTGGGASWAEAQMKAGNYAVAAAPAGTRPDLTGLSCRWNPIESHHGDIVSIIAIPGDSGADAAFQQLVSDIVALAAEQERGGHPVPADGPIVGFPPRGMDYELRATAPKGKRLWPRIVILAETMLMLALDWLNKPLGRFDPKLYRSDVPRNSDFRKFDDGLKMTIDVDGEILKKIENRLESATQAGVCRYGLHRQNSALMTCIVPSPMTRDHMHFIDGAAGGYAMAASHLKARYAN